jgi:uncharacterized membrane protein YccC
MIEAFRGAPVVLGGFTLLGVIFMVAFENYVLAVAIRSCLAPLAGFALHFDPITIVEARFLGVLIGASIGTSLTLLFTIRQKAKPGVQ